MLMSLVLCFHTFAKEGSPRLLLVTGANNHNWKATTPVLRELLEKAGFEVRVTEEPATLETGAMKEYAGIVLNYNRKERWPASTEKALLDLVHGGQGLIVVHAADNAFPGWTEFEEMVGLTWRQGATHDHYGEFTVNIKAPDHPIMNGLADFQTQDELYHHLTSKGEYEVLATAVSQKDQQAYPMLLVRPWGEGRVFHTLLGHDVASMQTEGFIKTFQRGTQWAVKHLPEESGAIQSASESK